MATLCCTSARCCEGCKLPGHVQPGCQCPVLGSCVVVLVAVLAAEYQFQPMQRARKVAPRISHPASGTPLSTHEQCHAGFCLQLSSKHLRILLLTPQQHMHACGLRARSMLCMVNLHLVDAGTASSDDVNTSRCQDLKTGSSACFRPQCSIGIACSFLTLRAKPKGEGKLAPHTVSICKVQCEFQICSTQAALYVTTSCVSHRCD
jgi:hypothetical protein